MNFLKSEIIKLFRFFKSLSNSAASLTKATIKNTVIPFTIRKYKDIRGFFERKFNRFGEYVEYLKLVNKRKGFLGAVKFAVLGDSSTSRFRRSMVSAVMTYFSPVLAAVLLLNVVAYATGSNYCVQISFDGETVAYVENEAVYNDAQAELRSRISYAGSTDKTVEFKPEFNVVNNFGHTLTEKDELANILMAYASEELTDAYGVYAGNDFIGAVFDKTEIEKYVKDYFNKQKTEYGNADISFNNEIYYIDGIYLSTSVKTADKIKDLLLKGHTVTVNYVAENVDTVNSVAEKFGISIDEFNSLNPDITDEALSGEVTLKVSEPYLSVVIKKTETVNEEIPFETITTEDATMSANQGSVVTVKGQKGLKEVTYNITERNGIVISRTVVSEKKISEPVNEQVTKGTLIEAQAAVSTPSSDASNSTQTASQGKYLWPVGGSGGYISCPFSGAYGHTGIDIAATLGTPVYSATDGVVVKAQSGSTGYGNLIVIQNNDGYLTYYAHLSYIGVTVGQAVSQGEFIGEVGSTGNSTGPHLHFEVRSGSTYLGPLNFLG